MNHSRLPCQKEWLIKIIKDIDHDVVVAGRVDIWSGKLTVDKNALLGNAQGRDGAVRNVPSEKDVRIFAPDHQQ